MPRGGYRPGSGRKPGFSAIDKLNRQARTEAMALIGGSDDPVRLALAYARDDGWPKPIRAQLVLGVMSVVYPKLVAQTIQSTTMQVQVRGDALAAKTALLLERGPLGPGQFEAGQELEGEAEAGLVEGVTLAELGLVGAASGDAVDLPVEAVT